MIKTSRTRDRETRIRKLAAERLADRKAVKSQKTPTIKRPVSSSEEYFMRGKERVASKASACFRDGGGTEGGSNTKKKGFVKRPSSGRRPTGGTEGGGKNK